MISFHAWGVRFSLPLLTLLYPILAAQLGMQGEAFPLMLVLGVHEFAHLAAAALLGIRIQEIRLMPFGGSARMENPYAIPAHRLIPVAAAGPIANFLLALLFAALAQWNFLSAYTAAAYVRHSLVLCLFNLLPALPLDGGRILYAILQRMLGEKTALHIGIWLGRILAAVLLAAAILGGIRFGYWNLSFILAAAFLLSSARDERTALYKSHTQRLYRPLDSEDKISPVRIYQAPSDTYIRELLPLLRPRERSYFAVIHQGRTISLINEEIILNHIIENGAADTCLRDLIDTPQGLPDAAPKV